MKKMIFIKTNLMLFIITTIMDANLTKLFEYVTNRSTIKLAELQQFWDQLINPSETAPEPVKAPEVKTKCIHVMVRGTKEGQACGVSVKAGTSYCSKHQKNVAEKNDKKMLIVDEEDDKKEQPVKETVAPVKETVAPVKETVAPVKETVAPVKETPSKQEKSQNKSVKKSDSKKKENEFSAVQIMTVEDTKKLDFRVSQREYNLDHKKYTPVEAEKVGDYMLVKNTKVVLNDEKTSVLGYLDEQNQLICSPNRATDRVVIDHGIPFDTTNIEDDIDE
jgi:hypothetical protein